MPGFVELLTRSLVSEGGLHGFDIDGPVVGSDDDARWDICKDGDLVGKLESNGEVYDLEISKNWHFYLFEYDKSGEVIKEIFLLLEAYLLGSYAIRRALFTGRKMVIASGSSEWEGRWQDA